MEYSTLRYFTDKSGLPHIFEISLFRPPPGRVEPGTDPGVHNGRSVHDRNQPTGRRPNLRRNLSLPLRLALLVAGTTLPMILFAAGVVYLNHARDRDAAFDRVLSTVRGILLVLDAEALSRNGCRFSRQP